MSWTPRPLARAHQSQALRNRLWWAGVIALPFAEVAVTVALARWLGAAIAFGLYAVPACIGLLVQLRYFRRVGWNTGFRRAKDLRDPESWRAFWEWQVQLWILVLWLVPGVLSHGVALCYTFRPPAAPTYPDQAGGLKRMEGSGG